MSSINCQARTTPLSEEHLSALDALNDRWNEALSSGAARCGAQHRLMLEELSFEEMCEEWLLFVTQLQVTLATPLSWEGLLEQARYCSSFCRSYIVQPGVAYFFFHICNSFFT